LKKNSIVSKYIVPYTSKAKITPVKRNRSAYSNSKERPSLERKGSKTRHSNLLTASKRKTMDNLKSEYDLLKKVKSPCTGTKQSKTTRPNMMHKQSETSFKRDNQYTNMLLNQSNAKSQATLPMNTTLLQNQTILNEDIPANTSLNIYDYQARVQ